MAKQRPAHAISALREPVSYTLLVGTPQEVSAAMAHQQLVPIDGMRPRHLPDGRLVAPVHLPAGRRYRTARRRRVRITVAVTAAVVVVGGLGWLAYLAVAAAVEVVTAAVPAALGITAAVVAGWLLLGRAGVCAGLHCPGCRHH